MESGALIPLTEYFLNIQASSKGMNKLVRMFLGYILIIIFLPVFVFLITITSEETKKVQSFHEVLDERIHIEKTNLSQSSYIKDKNGQVISEIHRPMNRTYIGLDQIPSFLQEILIVSEDQYFYDHPGFDLTAIARALAVNIQASEIEEGASTITQQLARNLYLNHEQSYNRKVSELLYAYELERTYSKEEILELYFNTIYFHNGAYGIEAAANLYFQKSAADLSKAQLAFLAAIPNNPTYYDPILHFDHTKERQERLIGQLEENNSINHEEAEEMKQEEIVLSIKQRVDLYPDYTTYVEAELKDLIAHAEGFDILMKEADSSEQKSLEEKLSKRMEEILASGVIIETSLNPSIQENAMKAIKRHLPYKDIEGSITVIDHKQHEIVALIGGKSYKKYDFHRAFQAYRQPGSAIKPLLDYAPYLERTGAPLSEKISSDAFCKNGYCPENYGGAIYGMVTLEKAFSQSYNTSAVRLLNQTGIENAFADLKKFQFKKVTDQDHVLPAAVGGFTYGMTSLELTNAYTVFSNEGFYQPSRAIRQVTDLSGKVLYAWDDKAVSVWNSSTISKMRILLNKAVVSGTARKANFPSTYIGGKTGTTTDYHDYWFVGLTENVTAGVWIGKDNPGNIKSIQSAAPQLRIWKDIVSNIE